MVKHKHCPPFHVRRAGSQTTTLELPFRISGWRKEAQAIAYGVLIWKVVWANTREAVKSTTGMERRERMVARRRWEERKKRAEGNSLGKQR